MIISSMLFYLLLLFGRKNPMSRWLFLSFGLVLTSTTARAQDAEAIARGKKALETRAFHGSYWSNASFDNAWKHWQPKPDTKPANYDQAFRDYYGLHTAPFDNGGLPMGLRKGTDGKGLTIDCLLCHGGSIAGKSYVGLGNTSLDLEALFDDLTLGSGRKNLLPFPASRVRGTNEAFAMTVLAMSFRNPDLGPRMMPQRFGWDDQLCGDVPAWWHLKRKKTMYHTGSHDARSVRSLMQFMLGKDTPAKAFEKEEPVFRDIQAYLLSMTPPKYPFPIDEKVAAKGRNLFVENCAKCHGTYGQDAKYPNKIVSLDVVGTDARRLHGIAPAVVIFYNQSWFAQEKPVGLRAGDAKGYQAPPLDGIWATAPYFHNGSVPTLYHVLNSKTRPALFTRSYRTDDTAYDKIKVGWKVDEITNTRTGLTGPERRKMYDTARPGQGNGGHTFGDHLNEEQRWAVIEYLKTL
jgi:mono/diheme cytochrome c family protein